MWRRMPSRLGDAEADVRREFPLDPLRAFRGWLTTLRERSPVKEIALDVRVNSVGGCGQPRTREGLLIRSTDMENETTREAPRERDLPVKHRETVRAMRRFMRRLRRITPEDRLLNGLLLLTALALVVVVVWKIGTADRTGATEVRAASIVSSTSTSTSTTTTTTTTVPVVVPVAPVVTPVPPPPPPTTGTTSPARRRSTTTAPRAVAPPAPVTSPPPAAPPPTPPPPTTPPTTVQTLPPGPGEN